MTTFDFLEVSDHSIACEFSRRFQGEFIVSNGNPYYWTGFYWDSQNATNQMSMYLSKRLYPDLDLESSSAISDNTELMKIKKCLISRLRNCKAKEQIMKEIMVVMNDSTIKLDNKPDLFVFQNAVFNLKTGQIIEPNQKDYLTQHVGYNYRASTPVEMDELTKVIHQILPIEDERTYYLKLLSTGISGYQLDKFIMANNGGGNGKNVIHDLMRTMLGDMYSFKGATSTLQDPTRGGARPDIAMMNKKRFILFSEPDANKPLCGSVIKEITGDMTVNARLLYENEMNTVLNGTVVMMCNQRPNFNEVNDAIERRLVDFPFRSTFMDRAKFQELIQYNQGQPDENYHEKNPHYTTAEFREKVKYAMFDILLMHYLKYNQEGATMPKAIKERSHKYLEGCDEFFSWFNDNYEQKKTEPRVYVSISDLFDEVKMADFYGFLTREQKRAFTKKGLIKTISENIFLKRNYCEKYENMIHGKRTRANNVIMDYQRREPEIDPTITNINPFQ